MSAKEDLQKKIQMLEDQLATATESLNQILIAECPYKPGMVVARWGDRYIVFSVRVQYGKARPWGKKILKNGEPGNREFELYGEISPVA